MTAYYPSQAGYATSQPVYAMQQPTVSQPVYAMQQQPQMMQQPVMYQNPSYYGAQPTVYVPSSSTRSHSYSAYEDDPYGMPRPRRRARAHRRYHTHGTTPVSYMSSPYYSAAMPMSTGQPMMMQPTMAYAQPGYPGGHPPQRMGFWQRMRMFFGLSAYPAFKYQSDKSTWGFMGYGKRPRYQNAYTGQEVTRDGHAVIRA